MDERKKDILSLNDYAEKLRRRADEAQVYEAAPLARIPIVEQILTRAGPTPCGPLRLASHAAP